MNAFNSVTFLVTAFNSVTLLTMQDLLDGLLEEGVPPRARELEELLRSSIGVFEPIVCCHNDLTPENCILDADGTV